MTGASSSWAQALKRGGHLPSAPQRDCEQGLHVKCQTRKLSVTTGLLNSVNLNFLPRFSFLLSILFSYFSGIFTTASILWRDSLDTPKKCAVFLLAEFWPITTLHTFLLFFSHAFTNQICLLCVQVPGTGEQDFKNKNMALLKKLRWTFHPSLYQVSPIISKGVKILSCPNCIINLKHQWENEYSIRNRKL